MKEANKEQELVQLREAFLHIEIYTDLEAVRPRCGGCNVKQPSLAALPPRPFIANPEFKAVIV